MEYEVISGGGVRYRSVDYASALAFAQRLDAETPNRVSVQTRQSDEGQDGQRQITVETLWDSVGIEEDAERQAAVALGPHRRSRRSPLAERMRV